MRPITFGCVVIGSAVLFILRFRLLLYSAGSGVNRLQVGLSGFSVRLLCFVQAKTLCRYGCMYFLAAFVFVLGCVVSVCCVGFASLDGVCMIVPGMLVCSSFLISVCMFIVSKALLISSATVIVRAGGVSWLNPFATVLFNVCSAINDSVLYPCCVGVNTVI